ncbi:MAG: PAS-domain containing protein [Rhizobiaceae bacterium]|nr:PAS-domain containing protein [Rhizobiaceae bacterium]
MPKSGSGDTPNYSLFEILDKHVLRDKIGNFSRQGSLKRGSLYRLFAHFSKRRALLGVPIFFCAAAGFGTSVLAAGGFLPINFASVSGFFAPPFGSVEIMMLAIFGGAMSFALLAANWLIRERSRISGENHLLKNRLSILRASHERTDALVNINDQCTVVWDGSAQTPEILGSLASTSGIPKDHSVFLAFGTWLKPDSASDFEKALKDLRLNASSFDLPLQTRGGGILEAQGRTSGGHAFVRFIELGGERAALAKLESDHVQLLSTIDNVQKLFEKIDMPIWLKDKENKLFWANQAYANAVDASNGEAAVTQDIQLFDGAERGEITAGHQNSNHFSGRLPAVISGDRRMVDVVDVATENGGAGIAIDRSDIEIIKTTLSKTIASHTVMLDQLATAVAIFDSSKRLQFANTSFQQLWALEPSLLEGNPTHGEILDAMLAGGKLPEQPDWRKWREEQLTVYQALEQSEIWWHLPDGTTLRVISNPQEQGGATWTFENVTEQLALESNYNALIKVQGETLDHLHEAVAVFGSDGKLRLSNPAFSTMWEFEDSNHALEGCHVGDLLDAVRERTGATEILDDIVREITGLNDERETIDGRLELNDGTIVDVTLVSLPQAQSMLTFTDKTDTIKVERALEQRAEALEASDQLKSKLIQHVSYELRAPLTSISGFGELLTNGSIGSLSGKQSEYVGHINEASETLKAIVDDILDLATMDAGVLSLDMQEVALQETIHDSLEGLQGEIKEHDLTVKIEVAEEGTNFIADRERLQQVLYNLISNAVNFSPDGGKIVISGKSRATMVEIAISDEGQGVPDNMKNTIFDRFESGSIANQRQGTGLGLSIVKSLVNLHGGRVFVENTETGGARFVCQFPRNPAQKQSLDAAE